MKEKFTCIAAAAALTAGVLLGGTVRAAAYTADDVDLMLEEDFMNGVV